MDRVSYCIVCVIIQTTTVQPINRFLPCNRTRERPLKLLRWTFLLWGNALESSRLAVRRNLPSPLLLNVSEKIAMSLLFRVWLTEAISQFRAWKCSSQFARSTLCWCMYLCTYFFVELDTLAPRFLSLAAHAGRFQLGPGHARPWLLKWSDQRTKRSSCCRDVSPKTIRYASAAQRSRTVKKRSKDTANEDLAMLERVSQHMF